MMKLEQVLEGAINKRGIFTGYKPPNAKGEIKKDAIEQPQSINWLEHYSGAETYGLSPVKILQDENGSKGLCRWIGFDMDVLDEPVEFCKAIFKISSQLFCYRSSSNRWHLHLYLDDWTDVTLARKKAVAIEDKLKRKWGKGVDTGHTVPSKYTVEENKPGYWLFMPYSQNKKLSNSKLVCYSPSGNPLTKEQTEFRIHWRKNLLVASSVGTTAGQGGREPFLFSIAQEIKHYDLDLTLDEVNNNFNDIGDPRDLQGWKRSIEKSLGKPEYTKEYLEEHYENNLKEINGFWQKDLANTSVFKGTKNEPVELTEEQEQNQLQFYKDVIYIKLDDRWYDKTTGAEYKEKAIKITYGSYFEGDVIKTFGNNANAQLVEQTVYRPDLFVTKEDPIVYDEEDLPQLNNYRPGGVEPMAPDTVKLATELQQFKDLIKKLTGHEKIGHKDTGEEVDLYEYVLDHLSMPLQRPGVKIRSALLFHSKSKQVGKTTLSKIMQKILGANNTTVISPTNAIDRQKSFIENQLVFIDEIKIDGNIEEKKSVMNKLKPLMTDELHDCRPLFKDWRRVYATGSYILNTNFKDAMALDEDEARYTCIDVGKTREELGGDDFYDPLFKAVKFETLTNVVKHFLLNREISENFNPAGLCLKTKFLQEMHKAGGHPVLPEVEILFKAREEPFHQSILIHGEAWEYCKTVKKIRGKSSDFTHALQQLGCERVGEVRHRRSSKNLTVYIVRNGEFFTDKLKSEILNDYWIPLETMGTGNEKYSLSAGDVSILESKQKEIQAFEDFRFPVDNDDPESDLPFEEIRKRRKEGKNEE